MSELCTACQEKAASLLMEAVKVGHVEFMQALVAAGADVNKPVKSITPLFEAVRKGHVNCVNRLIQLGASVNFPNDFGRSPLYAAVLWNNDECLDLLLKAGTDINFFSHNTRTFPLLRAINNNNKKILKACIKAEAAVNLHSFNKSNTALMSAATKKDREYLEILIHAGADVNAKNCRLETALMFAVESRNSENVKLLLESGADVNVSTINKETALSAACSKRDLQCLDLLKNYGIDASKSEAANGRTFVNAALKGDISAMEWLLNTGLIDVNTVKYGSWTAVYTAAAFDCLESLEFLIKAGAYVNSSCSGNIPLAGAAKNGCSESMKVLIEAGADVNMACSQTGNTALLEAAVANQIDCVRSLLQSGAHVNIRNLRGLNALQSHVDQSNTKSKQLLMLLFAAGELPVQSITVTRSYRFTDATPNPIFDLYSRTKVVDLKDICRRVIRAHMIRIDPRVHLFDRIPKIGLPTLLVSYLLYDVSLSDTDD